MSLMEGSGAKFRSMNVPSANSLSLLGVSFWVPFLLRTRWLGAWSRTDNNTTEFAELLGIDAQARRYMCVLGLPSLAFRVRTLRISR